MPASTRPPLSDLSSAAAAIPEMGQSLLASFGMLSDHFGVDFRFHCAAGEAQWQVQSASLRQTVSQPYTLCVDLTATSLSAEPRSLLGAKCALQSTRLNHHHFVPGIVQGVAPLGAHETSRTLRLDITPAFSALGSRHNSRVLQAMTVPQAVETVMAPALRRFNRSYRLDLRRSDYPVREYIVQYEETDLAFVQRLLAHEGIWYYFEFPEDERGAEQLVLTDSSYGVDKVANHEHPIVIDLNARGGGDHELITAFSEAHRATQAGHHIRRYNWTHPKIFAESERPFSPDTPLSELSYKHDAATLLHYDTGLGQYTGSDAQEQSRLRNEQLTVEAERYAGRSNVLGLVAGRCLVIDGHPHGLDGRYLITMVHHRGVYHTDSEKREEGDYNNNFECVRLDVPFRPTRLPKPQIAGVMLAHVVGPDGKTEVPPQGDAIHVDARGRVQVRFAWDRSDPASDEWPVKCWLRCAQLWSGSGFGAQVIPRIGMEVVVSFVNGDPDQPIVTGCVYNGVNDFPYALPEHKNRTGFCTSSNPLGTGANELRFDDTRGREEVYVHAQHDYNEVVENDHATRVRKNQTNEVEADQSEKIGRDQRLEVTGTRSKVVHGDEESTVGGERATTITGRDATTIESDRETRVSGNVTEDYLAGRSYSLAGTETVEVGEDRREHIRGKHELTTDTEYKLEQGTTTLRFHDHAVELTAGGAITLKHDSGKIVILKDGSVSIQSGERITFSCGSSKLVLAKDKATLESETVEVKGVQGALKVDAAGAALTGMQCNIDGSTGTNVTGAMVKLN